MDKQVIRNLQVLFWAPIIISAALYLIYENNLLIPGGLHLGEQGQYVLLGLTEVFTLAVIPFSLYMFKISRIHNSLVTEKWPALSRYGTLRLCMLGGMMMLNTILYYISGMNDSFGYMALALLCVMPFVFPSSGRCKIEVGDEKPEEDTTAAEQKEGE